jgi:hypothetical protein
VPILNLSSSIALKLLPSTRAAMAALAGDGIQSTPIPIGRFDPPPHSGTPRAECPPILIGGFNLRLSFRAWYRSPQIVFPTFPSLCFHLGVDPICFFFGRCIPTLPGDPS